MKTFTMGKRYGLVPYEQTHYYYPPKDRWDALRRVGVYVLGVDGDNHARIEPAGKIYENVDPFIVLTEYICDWEAPKKVKNDQISALCYSVARGGGKNELAKKLLNYQYGMNAGFTFSNDFAEYYRKDVEITKNMYENRKKTIKDVKFNGPATIVFWEDGTKTVVKAENENFDPEKGIAMAIAKHFLGTNKTGSNYYDQIKKFIPKNEEKK